MTEDASITNFFSLFEEKGEPSEINIAYILEIIASTKINPEDVRSYTDPKIVPSQNLDLSLRSFMQTVFWKISQRAHNTLAFQKFPESMDIWGEIVGLGVGVKYIIGVYEGKYQPGINTHPFSGSGWNIDDKRIEEIASTVERQLEFARAVLNKEKVELPKGEIEGIPLITAMCCLKIEY